MLVYRPLFPYCFVWWVASWIAGGFALLLKLVESAVEVEVRLLWG